MYRSIPTANKIIERKTLERNRVLHEKKLQEMKCSIDRDVPSTFGNLKYNPKKIQMQEEKISEIEKDNRLLLEKLTHIMKDPRQNTSNNFRVKSLNRDYRKRELVKITIENQAILKRIQDKKSSYNRQDWNESRKKAEGYLKNISQYPFQLYSTSKNPSVFQENQTDFESSTEDIRSKTSNSRLVNLQSQTLYTNKPPFDNSMGMNPQSTKYAASNPSGNHGRNIKLESLPEMENKKTILFQAQKQIGFNNYHIQFYVQDKTFKIVASNKDRSVMKIFVCSENEGEQLLNKFEYNYKAIVDRIKFKGNLIAIDEDSFYEENSGRKRDDITSSTFNHNDKPQDLGGLNGAIKEEEEMKEMIDLIHEHTKKTEEIDEEEEEEEEEKIEKKSEELSTQRDKGSSKVIDKDSKLDLEVQDNKKSIANLDKQKSQDLKRGASRGGSEPKRSDSKEAEDNRTVAEETKRSAQYDDDIIEETKKSEVDEKEGENQEEGVFEDGASPDFSQKHKEEQENGDDEKVDEEEEEPEGYEYSNRNKYEEEEEDDGNNNDNNNNTSNEENHNDGSKESNDNHHTQKESVAKTQVRPKQATRTKTDDDDEEEYDQDELIPEDKDDSVY